jgi:hypothetical protein
MYAGPERPGQEATGPEGGLCLAPWHRMPQPIAFLNVYEYAPRDGLAVACPVRCRSWEMKSHMDGELRLLGTRDEMNEMVGVLVRDCGCGCSLRDGEFISPMLDCAAMRGLRDRRFILGMLFARRLRPQLEAEEGTRTPLPPRSRRG